jgi:hypothetical protein
VERECGVGGAKHTNDAAARLDAEVMRAFEVAFQREPVVDELSAARAVAEEHGFVTCCRALLAVGELSELE